MSNTCAYYVIHSCIVNYTPVKVFKYFSSAQIRIIHALIEISTRAQYIPMLFKKVSLQRTVKLCVLRPVSAVKRDQQTDSVFARTDRKLIVFFKYP